MVDLGSTSNKGRWICPNDRQLALRAKLRTGWSVKTHLTHTSSYGGNNEQGFTAPLNDQEQDAIKEVIKRAEMLEVTEQERVGKLVDRLDNMKRNAMGNGVNQCILCGDQFGMLGAPSLLCHDCKKSVCSKCGIDTFTAQKEAISLCKICSETREMWKKSGAWFFKGLPKYTLPQKKNLDTLAKYGGRRGPRTGSEKTGSGWSKPGALQGCIAKVMSEEEESSSDDELIRKSRQVRIRQYEEADAMSTTGETVRQGSCVTFDLSESASIASDMDPVSDRSGSKDREELTSYETEAQFYRQDSGDVNNHNTSSPTYPSLQGRRDSQASTLSRDWFSSEDRVSLASSQRTSESVDETVSNQPIDNALQLGTLELSLLYNPMSMSLHCSLHRAKGLKAMDINSLSDPFCRLNLIPSEGKSHRLRTKTVHKTRNPEFNETLTFYGVSEHDIGHKTLHIQILDDDKYGHDFIGEARIVLSRLRPEISRYMNVYLEKRYHIVEEEDVWSKGQILVTLCYSTRKRALIVGIVRCVNLTPMDNNGLSDPFVKLRLKPDSHHRKFKTSVKWKNLNPTWNEEFVFETKMTDLPKQALEISVWDKDYGKSNDYLGGLQLGWHSKGERLRHWVDMIKFPDHKHEGWHNLGEDLLPE